MQTSIIRRSLVVTSIFVGGHIFNYVLLVGANRLLAVDVFGVFYLAFSLLNVIVTPTGALTTFYSRHFALIFVQYGAAPVVAELWRILRVGVFWGSSLTIAGMVAAVIGGKLIGVTAIGAVLLLPLIAYALFVLETMRAALQGMQRFIQFSVALVACQITQCFFGTMGFYRFGTASSGLVGMLAGALIVIVLVPLWLPRGSGSHAVEGGPKPEFDLVSTLFYVAGIGLYVLLTTTDVLVAYLVLPPAELGAYAASAFLPKAIVSLTLPISQILLPVIISEGAARHGVRRAILKAMAVTFATSGAAALLLYVLAPVLLVRGPFAIRSLDPGLMGVLVAAAVALSLLRVFVIADLGRGVRWRPLLLLIPILGCATVAIIHHGGAYGLATLYLAVVWLSLIMVVLAGRVTITAGPPRPHAL